MDPETVMWGLAAVALVISFRSGQKYEREEAPRRQKKQQADAAIDDALVTVAVIAAGRGEGSSDFISCLNSMESVLPGIKHRWSLLSEEKRFELAVEGMEALQDPEVIKRMEEGQERLKALTDDLMSEVRDMRGPQGGN